MKTYVLLHFENKLLYEVASNSVKSDNDHDIGFHGISVDYLLVLLGIELPCV